MNLRVPIIYGFMIALGGTLLMLSLLGLDMIGPDTISSEREMIGGTILFLMMYLFLLIGIYFALKRKKEENRGMSTFTGALKTGILTSFSAAVSSVLFTMLFYEVIYPEYVTDLMVSLESKMELEKIPNDRIAEKLKEQRTYYSTLNQSLYSFIGNFTTGGAFSLLLSFFLKNNKRVGG